MKAGVALNPHTSVESIRDVAGELDLVCLMSVNPGFGGQSFIERTYAKTRAMRELLEQEGATDALIEIDGGVGMGNARALWMQAPTCSWRVLLFSRRQTP